MPGRGDEERYFTGHDEWANERTVGSGGVLEHKCFREINIQTDNT